MTGTVRTLREAADCIKLGNNHTPSPDQRTEESYHV